MTMSPVPSATIDEMILSVEATIEAERTLPQAHTRRGTARAMPPGARPRSLSALRFPPAVTDLDATDSSRRP